MKTYKEIVETFENATTAHLAVQSFAEGPIDYLDAHSQNTKYPFMFLRPLVSTGLSGNIRTLTFELYSLDVPKLSNESPLLLKSNTELYIYDILGYIRFNSAYGMDFNLNNITPVQEAFNDRVFGWVANINITEEAVYNFCNFPS